MKLERITDIKPGIYAVQFGQDGLHVIKPVRCENVVDGKDVTAADRLNMRSQLLLATREAQRDLAYMMFGEDWRQHVGAFWGPVQEWERTMGVRAAEMRPDLFGEVA